MDITNEHKNRFCRSCGTELSASFIFCPGCGKSVGDSDAVAANAQLPESPPDAEKKLSPEAEQVMMQFDAQFQKLKSNMQNPLRGGIPFITRSPISYIKDPKLRLWITVSFCMILFGMIVGSYYLVMKFFMPYLMNMHSIY